MEHDVKKHKIIFTFFLLSKETGKGNLLFLDYLNRQGNSLIGSSGKNEACVLKPKQT